MAGHSQKTTQVTVCHICGDRGFSNALFDCSECFDTVVHQYCLGIPPGSIDESFNWLCEKCWEPAECEPCISMTPGDVSTKRSEESCHVSEDTNGVKPKMKDISSIYSRSFTHKGKRNKQKRKRPSFILDTETVFTLGSQCKNRVKRPGDQSLLTKKVDDIGKVCTANMPAKVEAKAESALSTKVTGHTDDILKIREEEKRKLECVPVGETTNDQDNMEIVLVKEQPEPLLTLMPIEYGGSLEQEETSYGSLRTEPTSMGHLSCCRNEPGEPVSSIMDCPQEIMTGVVLLVSPSGEIYIECASFTDDPCSTSLTTVILRLTSSFNNINSDDLVADKHGQTAQSGIVEQTVLLDEPSLGTDEVGCCSDMHDQFQQISEVSKADAPMEEDQPLQTQITEQQKKHLSREEMLRLKQENLARLQEEVVELEGELESTKEHRKELECALDNIRPLRNSFRGVSLADGLI